MSGVSEGRPGDWTKRTRQDSPARGGSVSGRSIQIKELRLRATGLTRAEGRRLAECVAQQLLDLSLEPRAPKAIPALSLNVKSRGSESVDQIAQAIAQQ